MNSVGFRIDGGRIVDLGFASEHDQPKTKADQKDKGDGQQDPGQTGLPEWDRRSTVGHQQNAEADRRPDEHQQEFSLGRIGLINQLDLLHG